MCFVVADNATGRTRYRILETVRQYRQFPRFARSSLRLVGHVDEMSQARRC
jgi:hypothetical protein